MKKKIGTGLAALFLAGAAYGQTIQHPYKVNAFGDVAAADSLDLYNVLHNNAPGDFPGSAVPYATIVGKDGKFILGAGGFVKGVVGWDIGHPIPNPDEFITSQIPMGPMEGDGCRFNLSARQTLVYVNFIVLPESANQIGAFVGANLLSDDYIPVVQYAFLRYRGFKVGYDNTLFSDPACGAPAVDYEGPCSNTCSPVAGLGYSWQKGNFQLGAGVELPQASFTVVEGKTKSVYQRVPDIPLAAQWSWDGGNSWVRASAILRNMAYRDLSQGKNHNAFGYGFQISGGEYFLDRFTFYWQGVWGKGIASMLQDTAGEELDLTPVDNGYSLAPPMIWGGFLALRYDITGRITASVTYSQMRTYAKRYQEGETLWDDQYKYAQYVSSNIFFEVARFFEIGLEHIWGRRTDYDGKRGSDNRIQASFQLTF